MRVMGQSKVNDHRREKDTKTLDTGMHDDRWSVIKTWSFPTYIPYHTLRRYWVRAVIDN